MSVENVTTNNITRDQFAKKLDENQVDADKKTQALSIFDKNDVTGGNKDKTLDATEQKAVNKALAEANLGIKINDAGEVEVQKQQDPPKADDAAKTQQKGGTDATTKPDDKKTGTDIKPAQFANDNAAKLATYRYLLNNDSNLKDEELSNIQNSNLEIGHATGDGDKSVYFVKYGDKYYQIRTNNGKTEIVEDATENYTTENGKISYKNTKTVDKPSTLMKALIDSASTDTKHNYVNRHGKAGNAKSHYDGTKIVNTSTNRQQVNPVQTFTSMLLNNDENSTLTFNNNLSGQDILDVVLTGQNRTEHKDEMSMNDLIKYLNAEIKESSETTKAGKNRGTRTAAGDVDMDLKDMANIGAIFNKYDTNHNGYLNASELDALIKDLTSGKSTSKIAKDAYKEPEIKKPENHHDTPPTPHNDTTPHLGKEMKPNKTRYEAGTDKKQKVEYHYENGLRTLVENGKAVKDMNIAEYKDHGLFGAGKKDFIKIKGLPANVRAEVIQGKLRRNNIRIKVKDAEGHVKYYKVTYNSKDKTYTLGAEINKNGAPVQPQTEKQVAQPTTETAATGAATTENTNPKEKPDKSKEETK